MNKKAYYLAGALLLLVFGGYSFSAFRDSLTPYVPYEKARSTATTVQVAGGLEKGTSYYDEASGFLHFTLTETEGSDTMKVRYQGVKPANFEDAISIVAIGSYDPAGDEFAADKLLVKCPSKYQGIDKPETKEYG